MFLLEISGILFHSSKCMNSPFSGNSELAAPAEEAGPSASPGRASDSLVEIPLKKAHS